MKVGTLLLIAHDVIGKLESSGLLTADGEFAGLEDLKSDVALAVMIEECAKARGVQVKEDVDKILHALPLLMSFVR